MSSSLDRLMGRRKLLMSGAALGLVAPVLRASRAEAAAAPRRLVVFGTPNGINRLSAAGLSPEMAKLASDTLFLDGISMKAADDTVVPGIDDHAKGPPVMFTAHIRGRDLADGRSSGRPLGPSLDQFVVDRLKPPTRLPSLELGVGSGAGMIFGTNLGAIPLENSPANALSRVLGGVMVGTGGTTVGGTGAAPTDTMAMDRLRARRKSVLDLVNAELNALKPRLVAAERTKLDGHLESLRALEKRLLPPTGGSSGPVSPPPQSGPACNPKAVSGAGGDFAANGRAQLDILAMALACDLTRVASVRWGGKTHNITHKWAGVSKGHHDIAHSDDVASLTKVVHWYGDQFAYLMGKLKSMTDAGGGSVLDNTILVWNSDMANGGHGWLNGCMVVGGGRALGIKTGRMAKYNGASQNDLFMALLQALGVDARAFGNPAFNGGPLSGVL